MKRFTTYAITLLCTAGLSIAATADIIPTYNPPADQKIAPLELPPTYHTTLANGLQITTIEQHEVPTVSFTLAIRKGALLDPAGKEGTASLTASLLDRGTESHNGDEIAAELNFMATRIGGWSDWYSSYVRFSCLTRYLEPTLDLFSEVLLHPTFPEKEFENSRTRLISSRQQALDSPRHLVRKQFSGAINKGSRYAIAAGGDLETLPAITREDVVTFHHNHYSPAASELIIVGDVEHNDMVRLVEARLNDWQGTAVTAAFETALPEPTRPGVIIINKPDATNATLRFGHLGVPRNHPDFYAIQVMNSILGGGGFSSRLMQRIRTELGYTYGIYSGFGYERDTGTFSIGAAVTASGLQHTISEALTIINTMREEPVGEQELSDARTYLAASYPLSFENPENLAGEILDSHVYGLPEADIVEYSHRILSVTKEDVLRVARSYITPASFYFVVCGNAAELEEQVKQFGEVTIVEIN